MHGKTFNDSRLPKNASTPYVLCFTVLCVLCWFQYAFAPVPKKTTFPLLIHVSDVLARTLRAGFLALELNFIFKSHFHRLNSTLVVRTLISFSRGWSEGEEKRKNVLRKCHKKRVNRLGVKFEKLRRMAYGSDNKRKDK